MAIDYGTDLGRVRLLASDVDEANLLLEDAQIQAFLDMEGGSVKLAAAQALDVIANSEVLVSKKIKTQDLSTDGPAVAKALREQAAELREQVEEGDELDGGGFDIAYWPPERTI